ncbi:Uncharacterised protein [uncultured archaeon]|nr:Uncharacterised protein [uncultured archaeon]
MLAWFNSSLRIRSPFRVSGGIEPRFAMYPVGNKSADSWDL